MFKKNSAKRNEQNHHVWIEEKFNFEKVWHEKVSEILLDARQTSAESVGLKLKNGRAYHFIFPY